MPTCLVYAPLMGADKTGIGNYAYQLLAGLDRTDTAPWHVSALAGAEYNFTNIPVEVFDAGRLGRIVNQQLGTGLSNHCDLVHFTDYSMPLAPWYRKPSIITVHDIAFYLSPGLVSPAARFFKTAVLRAGLRRSKGIICVSQSTKNDLCKFFGVPENKIRVIYHGADHIRPDPTLRDHDAKATLARLGIRPPCVLFVGTIEPRKNLVRLVRAFGAALQNPSCSKYRLVIAGSKGWMYEDVFDTVKKLGLEERVVFTGYLQEANLGSVYRGASAVLYPSLYEGFGFPVLEAMAYGVPVLTSNVSALPEVAGDAAILVDPSDVGSIAQGIVRILTDGHLRATLIARCYKQVKKFTWETTCRETLVFYNEVLGATGI
ncbi:MAG: glycosyltransferase family 1 protein [Clostridia bacterium]|nr:MAG: glycosyltransferase family 1 protein [Clostridia bacterium]